MGTPDASKLSEMLLEEEKGLDYKYYLHLFYKNISIIITFLVIAVTAGAIYGSKIPKMYSASTKLVLEKRITAAEQTSAEKIIGYQDWDIGIRKDYFNTQREIMKGPDVLGRTVKQLKLDVYFEVGSVEAAVGIVRRAIDVQQIKRSRLIRITTTTKDPKLSAQISDAIAENYIQKTFEDSLYYDKEILTW